MDRLKEIIERLAAIDEELRTMHEEAGGKAFDADGEKRWSDLLAEESTLKAEQTQLEAREKRMADQKVIADRAGGEIARRILITGSPAYRSAFFKSVLSGGMPVGLTGPEMQSMDEARALSVGTGSAGGFAVVYTLDPTVVPTSNFSVNPWRA